MNSNVKSNVKSKMKTKTSDLTSSSLLEIVEDGDVLIVIPPFVDPGTPSLGGHILQAVCRDIGVSTSVYYGSLEFPGIIGPELYETVMSLNQTTFIGERLFASAAFNLPTMGRNAGKLMEPGYIPGHVWQKNPDSVNRYMPEIFEPVRQWAKSIDWKEKERLASLWIETTARLIAEKGFRILGCSTTQGGLAPAIALLNRVKQIAPEIVTVLGGALCEGDMAKGADSLQSGVDFVYSGEGEISFPIFVKDALEGKLPKESIIHGEPVANLDTIPLPDYTQYIEQRNRASKGRIAKRLAESEFSLPYESSRGCQYGRCTFCGLNGKRDNYRAKSPDKVIHDLRRLTARFGINKVQMTDNIIPFQYYKTLIPRLSGELPGIDLLYEIKANQKLERVMALKEAGVNEVQPGIEALSDSLLKRICKGVTVKEIMALLRYGRSVDMRLYWNLLFGFPGDKIADYAEMLPLIPLISHLQPPDRFTTIKLFRFSKYQSMPEQYGIDNLRPADYHHDIFPDHADLDSLAYYFVADYEAESYENPQTIASLHKAFGQWSDQWEPYNVTGVKELLPRLHLERHTSGRYVLHDTRGLSGRPEKLEVSGEQAAILLVARPVDGSLLVDWSIQNKLGIVRNSWHVPLATADPELLMEFEKKTTTI